MAVLHVEARSGAVSVSAHGGAAVRVEATITVWSDLAAEADEAASLVARGMEQDEHRVIVRAPALPQAEGWSIWGGRRGARVEYSVLVPVRSAVRVLSRSGRVQVSGTEGRTHVECGSGRIGITGVTGEVSAVSRSGALAVERITGDVTLEARSGRIELRGVSGKASVQSRSGSIEVSDVAGDLEVRAHTGSLQIERAGASLQARAHTGAIRYWGRVEADFDIRAHTGSIVLAVDPATPFFIDAESETGSVQSELSPRRDGAPPADGKGPKVRLRSHTGAIRLTRL
jgi:hypothetical protein